MYNAFNSIATGTMTQAETWMEFMLPILWLGFGLLVFSIVVGLVVRVFNR